MYVRGFVRQGFNGVPEGATVTDTDRAATPSFIIESASRSTRKPFGEGLCDGRCVEEQTSIPSRSQQGGF